MANLPFFSLLFALCTPSSAANVLISIDCGSSVSYEDENGITWTGDDEFVKTGEPRSVQPSESFDRVTDTLRVFTNKRKNCYEMGPVKPGRVLVRATFYYGNYDGKSSPPEFHLILDGNYWGPVNNSGPTPSGYEVIYVTKKGSISVCVARKTEGQFPYMSALEVRSLEAYMDGGFDLNYPLSTRRRVDFGANATILRFPYDPYDRRWFRDEPYGNDAIQLSSDEFVSGALVSDDEPPPAVLKTAVSSNSSFRNSTIPILIQFPLYNISVYINMYFCELIRLRPNQSRSFYLLKDNQRFSPPISPPYGNCTRLNLVNLTVSSNTSFSLDASAPHQCVGVKGLALLQEKLETLKDWSGDPCVPASWAWVGCSDDSVPRVTSLNLSNNSLRGNIPDFLGELPNLQILNLEDNQFNATIPPSLLTRKGLILRVGGNLELECPSNISCLQVPSPAPQPNSSISKKKDNNNNSILQMLFTIYHSSSL